MKHPARTVAVPRRPDQGAVVVVVMLVMMGLLGLGVTALWLTSGNLQVGANTNLRSQALYVAEAGIEHAREILNNPGMAPDLTRLLTGANPAADDVPTNVDPTTGLPNGVGAIMVDDLRGGAPILNVAYPPASFQRGTAGGSGGTPMSTTMGTYTVWIRNDTAELRQGMYTTDGNTAVVVRARGVAPDGRTQVVVEATMGPPQPGANNAGLPAGQVPVLCNAGKNACDDNNSVVQGVVVGP